jgi:hypothetical protein
MTTVTIQCVCPVLSGFKVEQITIKSPLTMPRIGESVLMKETNPSGKVNYVLMNVVEVIFNYFTDEIEINVVTPGN